MNDEPKGYEQALGAVPWQAGMEPAEMVIRRGREAQRETTADYLGRRLMEEYRRAEAAVGEVERLRALVGRDRTQYDLAAEWKTRCDEQRVRGDTYRNRALVVYHRGRERAEYLTDIYHQAEEDFSDASDRAVAWEQRAGELAGLLKRAVAFIKWLMRDGVQLGPEEYERFVREIDAALPLAAGTAGESKL